MFPWLPPLHLTLQYFCPSLLIVVFSPEDERSIANRLAAADPVNDDASRKDKTIEQVLGEEDPTAPARMHGNEPSKGAQIDKEIQDEEAELIAKMDAKKAAKS